MGECRECGGGGYVPADAVTAHLRRPRVPCPSCNGSRERHADPEAATPERDDDWSTLDDLQETDDDHWPTDLIRALCVLTTHPGRERQRGRVTPTQQIRAQALLAAAHWEPRTFAGEPEKAALERLLSRAERLAEWITGDEEDA